MTAIRALMSGLVDYAGLFPPASLDMASAVRRYREYLTGENRWALGKFVVPATRLKEFSAVFDEVCCREREPQWRLSVLEPKNSPPVDVADEFPRGAAVVDAIEMKVQSVQQAENALKDLPGAEMVFVEFPPGGTDEFLSVLARFGARAKIRTGGVTAEAIPSTDLVARFLMACANGKVPFKATAGLHHAVHGMYRLTYEPESARTTMHGFVNVFLAAILAWRGEDRKSLMATLEEKDARQVVFEDDEVRWCGFQAGIDEIATARREFAISYGSCSFSEPMDEAKALGWL